METRWLYVTSEQFPKLREESKGVCVIPMGCIEKHGLHLPLGADILQASAIAHEASKIEPFTVFPDFIFGDVEGNYPSMPAGSVTLSVETEILLLTQLCEQIAKNGYKKIVIYNGHGGNVAWLQTFLRGVEFKPHDYVVSMVMIELQAPHKMAEAILKNGASAVPEMNEDDIALILKYHEEKMQIGHACMGETANMMAVCPEHVHLDRLGIESGLNTHAADKYAQHGIYIRDGGWFVNRPNAYSGHDPVGCNERIGKAALRMEAERLAAAMKFLKEDDDLIKWHNENWHTNI